jgi:hypothetical protein
MKARPLEDLRRPPDPPDLYRNEPVIRPPKRDPQPYVRDMSTAMSGINHDPRKK